MRFLATHRRRVLAAAVLLLLLIAAVGLAAVAGWARPVLTWLGLGHTAPPAEVPKETLLGLEVGSSTEDVAAQLGEPESSRRAHPWFSDARASVGHVLKPADLGDELSGLFALDVRLWSDGSVCVLLHQDVVRAVVVRAPHPAASARGVKVGDAEVRIEELYPEPADVQTVRPERGAWVKVYRCDRLGVGFELRDGRVAGITLYPPRPDNP